MLGLLRKVELFLLRNSKIIKVTYCRDEIGPDGPFLWTWRVQICYCYGIRILFIIVRTVGQYEVMLQLIILLLVLLDICLVSILKWFIVYKFTIRSLFISNKMLVNMSYLSNVLSTHTYVLFSLLCKWPLLWHICRYF